MRFLIADIISLFMFEVLTITRFLRKKIRGLLLLGPSVILFSCGGGYEANPVPPNSKILISPDDITWEVSPSQNCPTIDPGFYNDEAINISLLDSRGRPLGDVDLYIDLDLSGSTFSGSEPVVALYDDLNGNGKIDHPVELMSAGDDGIFMAESGKFTGSKTVFVRVYLSCTFRAILTAWAGPLSTSMSIEVVDKDESATQ